jgi:putative ABC transport system ATP-binding protein
LKHWQYIVEARNLRKSYTRGLARVDAIKGIDITVSSGEFVAIMGPSGSGKSTLLHILGCLERPDAGIYLLGGRDFSDISDRELSLIRAEKIGFVFQNFSLIPHLNVAENVGLPLMYSSQQDRADEESVLKVIEQVGLAHRVGHLPVELSGGEMQRVAIARALVMTPVLLLADEPTGNLDSKTGSEIMELFCRLHEGGVTILMVTHDIQVASRAERILNLKDGTIQ